MVVRSERPRAHARIRSALARRRTCAAAGFAVVALAAAGCGSTSSGGGSASASASSGGGGGGNGMTTVKVGVIPIGTQVPLYLGIRQGFFRAEGLNVQPQVMSGGSAIVPALVQGSVQFGFVNGATVVFGADRGLPVKVVSGGEGAPAQGHRDEDLSRLVVSKNSSITSPRQLEGRTIAVSGLRDAPELLTRAALAKQGVDVSKVHFVEIAYVDMLAALDSGRVDAAYLVTPYADQAVADGDRTLARPYYDTMPGLATAYYCTSSSYAAKNPQVVARFQAAMLRSLAYTNAHLSEARALLPSFTRIPANIIPRTQFGTFPTTLAQASDSLSFLAGQMVSFGWISKSPDIGSTMFSAGGGS